MKESGYDVVWPRGKKTVESLHLARRLGTLESKTVCALWDWIFRGREIFPAIAEELAKRYPGSRYVSFDEFGSIHGGDEAKVLAALPDKLRQHGCDAVISGVGC